MSELVGPLLPLLLVDVMNPVLFAAMLYATGSGKPVLNSTAMLLGHTTAYFLAGIVVSIGLEKVSARLANPGTVDYVIGLLVGLICLYAALGSRQGGASESREPEGELTAVSSFGFGAVINFVGVPFAVPYFAAIDQVLRANLSVADTLAVLGVYNLAYAAPFALIPILIAVAGDACRPFLQKLNDMLGKIADTVLPLILGLLGLALVVDAILFFVRGQGLY